MEKALFWDFDGTIILPNESFFDGVKIALKSYECIVNDDEIRQFLRSTSSWYTPEISYVENVNCDWWKRLFGCLNAFYEKHKVAQSNWKSINEMFKNYIVDYKNYTLYSDAKETLQKCMQMGYKNYILSNNFPELQFVAEKLGLSSFFADYFISSNIGYEKPRRELFNYALNSANNPKCSYMIGDNPIADIQGGKNASMKSILVHNSKSSDADFNCENLWEIPKLLL